jgi:hypothetical protein
LFFFFFISVDFLFFIFIFFLFFFLFFCFFFFFFFIFFFFFFFLFFFCFFFFFFFFFFFLFFIFFFLVFVFCFLFLFVYFFVVVERDDKRYLELEATPTSSSRTCSPCCHLHPRRMKAEAVRRITAISPREALITLIGNMHANYILDEVAPDRTFACLQRSSPPRRCAADASRPAGTLSDLRDSSSQTWSPCRSEPCSVYSVSAYGRMIADKVRVAAYTEALKRAITPGCTVLDIGTGTGFFAMLACRMGAARVYAIEPDDVIDLRSPACRGERMCGPHHLHQGPVDQRAAARASRYRRVGPADRAALVPASHSDDRGRQDSAACPRWCPDPGR